nr:putative cleavage and polyadenylation specificity factor subunit 4-like protein isoform X3 [Vicugna pacos]
MQEVIAGLERFTFTFEKDVEMQKGTGLLPFQGMDKSGSAVCNFFAKGLCEKGRLCPFRHDRGEKMVVCKHWLRGLCKKGDQCKFLHQYDVTRMPECYFYSKFEENVTLLPSMENQHRLLAVESHCKHTIVSFRSVVPEMVLCGQIWTHAPPPSDSCLCPPRGYIGEATANSRLVYEQIL